LQAEIAASDSSISKIRHIQDSSDDQGLALKMHYTTGAGFPGTARSRSNSKGNNMKNFLMRLWKEEEGQDLTEYALLITLISLALVTALGNLATAISTVFSNAVTKLT
jgi:Flp pilus assembly pilin Flp